MNDDVSLHPNYGVMDSMRAVLLVQAALILLYGNAKHIRN